jgi:hypothetical protein
MLRPGSCVVFLLFLTDPAFGQSQLPDPDFDVRVESPAYRGDGPVVVIDQAHHNFHTAEGRYRPFASLLRNDGFRVLPGTQAFAPDALDGIQILVIANAHSGNPETPTADAFTDDEVEAVHHWVRDGGSLLLIADHTPFGSAARKLGRRFGIDMGEGWVFEPGADSRTVTTQILYSMANGRLARHPILEGRRPDESVRRVMAFTGQSLGLPDHAVPLLILGPDAREAPDASHLNKVVEAVESGSESFAQAAALNSRPVAGRVQGLTMRYGNGRIVALAETAMLSAQVVTIPGDRGDTVIRVGMNLPDYDNRQFALNVVRWLAGALDCPERH